MQSCSRGLQREIRGLKSKQKEFPIYTETEKGTAENEVETRQDRQTSLGGLRASYFCALHSYQGEDGTKETQTYSCDHETPTHLDIGLEIHTRGDDLS